MYTPVKILLVDEDPDLIKVLGIVLRQHGYIVRTALSGSQAMDIFSRHSFDLAVIELSISDMSGITLMNKIRGIEPAQKMIAISVHPLGCRFWNSNQISIPFEGGILGSSDVKCLSKPFKLEKLLQLIKDFTGEVYPSPEITEHNSTRWRMVRTLLG